AHIVEPERFARVVSVAEGDELATALMMLMRRATNRWSLVANTDSSRNVVARLLESTNAGWRAAAVYVTGKNDGASASNLLSRAAQDKDAWVRLAAVQATARRIKDRAQLEERVGPFVNDPDDQVAALTATMLLEPEVRRSAGIEWEMEGFRF